MTLQVTTVLRRNVLFLHKSMHLHFLLVSKVFRWKSIKLSFQWTERILIDKRNQNAILFQWKIHGLLFKVLDRENEPSCFQETLKNSTKHCLE